MKKVLIIAAFLIAAATAYAGEYFMPAPKNPVVPPPLVTPEPPCLTYDFLDIQYLYTNFDHHELDDGHGVGANLSKSIGGPFYVTGSFAWTEADSERLKSDHFGASAGLGIRMPVTRRLDFNLEAGGLWSRADNDFKSYYDDCGCPQKGFRIKEDDYGFFAGPGVRVCVTERIELFGNVYYVYFDEDNYDTVEANVGVVFDLTEFVALKVGGLFGEDEQTLFVGARVYY